MNLEKFVKSPYRALVMLIVTLICGFFEYYYILHIVDNIPEEGGIITTGQVWLIPAIISAYILGVSTGVSFAMIFLDNRPKLEGLMISFFSNILGGLIVGLSYGLMFGLFGLLVGLIVGLMGGSIWDFVAEFKKIAEKPIETAEVATDGAP